jgi:hypothetical protein
MQRKLRRARARAGVGGAAAALVALATTGAMAGTNHASVVHSQAESCFGGSGGGCPTPQRSSITILGRTGVEHKGRITVPADASTTDPTTTTPPTTSTTTPAAAPVPAPPPAQPAQLVSAAWGFSLRGHLAGPIVAAASAKGGAELLMAGSDGGVFPVGQAAFWGSLSGHRLTAPVSAVAADATTGGYWLASANGGVFAFNSPYLGAASRVRLSAPVSAIAPSPTGQGYWLVAQDGGVFAFGDAGYYGSLSGSHLAAPIVAMAATPTGHGYWMVARDGGVFGFGDARFVGSATAAHSASPIRAVVSTSSGQGYWLVRADGAVFAYGDAPQVGSGLVADPPAQAIQVEAAAARRVPVASTITGYPPRSTGFDISQYQCGNIPPGPTTISIVQVTAGAIDNGPNPCYAQEARWAGPRLSVYIYMDGLPTPAPPVAMTGPAGACAVPDRSCQHYNYGYNRARQWVDYSRGLGITSTLWWLDVEGGSGWNLPARNALEIEGALAGLQSEGVQAGVYSTPSQWQDITGGLAIPGVPIWTPGAGNLSGPGYTATSFCAAAAQNSFGGGHLKLVQWGYQGPFPGSYSGLGSPYDMDLACPN